jgi:hypothetical protein
VRPGPTDVVFRITRDQLPTAAITGRVLDASGWPLGDIRVGACRERMNEMGYQRTEAGTGRFEITGLSAGKWWLEVLGTDLPSLRTPPHDLASGETWDVGEIRLPIPGTLHVRVKREPHGPSGDPWLVLVPLDGNAASVELELKGDEALSPPLAPGSYAIAVMGLDYAHTRQRVDVRSGERSEADVLLQKGCHKTLRLHVDGEQPTELARVSVHDAAGECVAEHGEFFKQSTCDIVLSQLPGTYSVEAVCSGRKGTATLTIEATSSAGDVVELWLQ